MATLAANSSSICASVSNARSFYLIVQPPQTGPCGELNCSDPMHLGSNTFSELIRSFTLQPTRTPPPVGLHWLKTIFDATLNVFEAARDAGVKRVVFASSLQVALGHLGSHSSIGTDLPVNPMNFYGVSKALGEKIGQQFAQRYGLSVICLRLGWVPANNDQPPDAGRSLALQHRWLSDKDLCTAITCAMNSRVDYGIVNISSRICGSPWSLEEARKLIGYEPKSMHKPAKLSPVRKVIRGLRRLARRRR